MTRRSDNNPAESSLPFQDGNLPDPTDKTTPDLPPIPPEGNPEEPTPVNDPDDELLTAYLDGELTSGETESTQQRLKTDPNFRERLEKLRAASRFLDSLETVPPNHELTATTMEILTSVVKKEIRLAEKRRVYHLSALFLLFLLIGVTVFLLAERGIARWLGREATQRQEDLPVCARLDALEVVGDFAFLTQLRTIPEFSGEDETPAPKKPPANPDAPSPPEVVNASTDRKLSREITFPPNLDRTELTLLQIRFDHLTEGERKKYRALYKEIAESPDAGSLFNVLDRFADWFWTEIDESDRFRFRYGEITPDDRFTFVQATLEKKGKRPSSGHPDFRPSPNGNLPPDPSRFAPLPSDRRRPKGFGVPRPNFRDNLPEPLRGEVFGNFAGFETEFTTFMKENDENLAGKQRREILAEFVRSKGVDSFLSQLSPEGKDYLVTLPEEKQVRQIAFLLQIAFFESENPPGRGREHDRHSPKPWRSFPDGPGGGGVRSYWKSESPRELAETLRNLPEKEREELLNLPEEEMYSRLLTLHWRGTDSFTPSRGGPRGPGQGRQGRPDGPSRDRPDGNRFHYGPRNEGPPPTSPPPEQRFPDEPQPVIERPEEEGPDLSENVQAEETPTSEKETPSEGNDWGDQNDRNDVPDSLDLEKEPEGEPEE